MNNEAILDYYICNGELLSTSQDIFNNVTVPSIYEVIRIKDGIPIFQEEHLNRMRHSAKLLGYSINKDNSEILNEINRLIQANNCENLNIKLVYSNINKDESIFLIYFIHSNYPEDYIYRKGIHTILYYSERENPNVKVVNADLRQKVNLRIKEEKAYEAILVNEDGFMTEGSRSNIFFVQENKIYTAPSGDVLLGITRSEILQICKDINIDVIEENVHVDRLREFNGVFMTGTSVGVLPVSTINDIRYPSVSNKVIEAVSREYIIKIKKYISSRKGGRVK
ncbi:aminotransferase class IV [Sporosalibacterium faouarense]|uniref:aminotransferase class IV n=1 Tax=Sporosalibacterium faouarense TaxID=516123 RepID=UPI001FAFDD7C|nr:aminotransferase class IV [Sporosalibacterium faouarense]